MADEQQEPRGLIEVPASEILAKIEKGEPVEYDGVNVKGDLDLCQINLPKRAIEEVHWLIEYLGHEPDEYNIIRSPIKIVNSQLDGTVEFGNAIFEEDITFYGTEFGLNAEFHASIFNRGAYFSGSQFKKANFSNTIFSKCGHGAFFDGASFWAANFVGAQFDLIAEFDKAHFLIQADFNESKFEYVTFNESNFDSVTEFNNAYLHQSHFQKTIFGSFISFNYAEFGPDAVFWEAQFEGDAYFLGAKFEGTVEFARAHFSESICFYSTEFKEPRSQEDVSRLAKQILEGMGDREEAGHYFYREMEAKRRQKPWYIRYPEYVFIQWMFGYGVHPFRLMACWFGFVFLFAAVYWLGHGIDAAASQSKGNATLVDYIWFSIATAVTPGYAGYKPTTEFKLVAGLEAIFGTFMWAAFIATFARKYMR